MGCCGGLVSKKAASFRRAVLRALGFKDNKVAPLVVPEEEAPETEPEPTTSGEPTQKKEYVAEPAVDPVAEEYVSEPAEVAPTDIEQAADKNDQVETAADENASVKIDEPVEVAPTDVEKAVDENDQLETAVDENASVKIDEPALDELQKLDELEDDRVTTPSDTVSEVSAFVESLIDVVASKLSCQLESAFAMTPVHSFVEVHDDEDEVEGDNDSDSVDIYVESVISLIATQLSEATVE